MSNVHPIFRPLLEAIAPSVSPLSPTPEQTAFAALQAEYRDFIWNIATDEPESGYNSVDDLPAISDEDRALVLRAKPDLVKGVSLDAEVLAGLHAGPDAPLAGLHARLGLYLVMQLHPAINRQVFVDVRTECDNRAERAAQRQYEDFHDGGRMTPTERMRRDMEEARRLK